MSLPRRLLLAPRAVADLDEIGTYIARDSPTRALTFLGELEAKCRSIAAAPELWPARPELAAGIRMAAHGRYLIFYRDLGDVAGVRIERVIHGARNVRRMF